MKFRGKNPNTKWKAISKEVLIKNSSGYIPLVPISSSSSTTTTTTSNSSPSFFEQGTQEWLNLRKGKLTASIFSTALGFFEKLSVKKLKLQPYFVGHSKVCNLIDYLQNKNDSSLGPDSETNKDLQTKLKWGNNHELNAVFEFLKDFKNTKIKETGLWLFKESNFKNIFNKKKEEEEEEKNKEEEGEKVEFDKLPKIGASPDGLLYFSKQQSNQKEQKEDNDKEEIEIENLTKKIEEMDLKVKENKENKENKEYKEEDKEDIDSLIEIKCPCPFIEIIEKDSKKKIFMYKKRNPHGKIPVYYIPQIQTQMFCTNVKKTYFLSWTPTNGMNVFEIPFSNSYIQEMLYWIQKFNQEFVKTDNIPKENYFFFKKDGKTENERYIKFLEESNKLSEKAKLVKTIPNNSNIIKKLSKDSFGSDSTSLFLKECE